MRPQQVWSKRNGRYRGTGPHAVGYPFGGTEGWDEGTSNGTLMTLAQANDARVVNRRRKMLVGNFFFFRAGAGDLVIHYKSTSGEEFELRL